MTTPAPLAPRSGGGTRHACGPLRCPVRLLVPAAAAGVVLGAAAGAGRGLPGGERPDVLVSAGAWVVTAGAVTAVLLARRRAAACPGPFAAVELTLAVLTGLLALEALVVGCFGAAAAVSGAPDAGTSVAWWVLAGFTAGPVAGAAAWAWCTGTRWVRAAGVAVAGAVLLSDGVWHARVGAAAGAGEAAAGVLVVVALLRGADRWRGLVVLAAAAALGAACLPVVDALWSA